MLLELAELRRLALLIIELLSIKTVWILILKILGLLVQLIVVFLLLLLLRDVVRWKLGKGVCQRLDLLGLKLLLLK